MLIVSENYSLNGQKCTNELVLISENKSRDTVAAVIHTYVVIVSDLFKMIVALHNKGAAAVNVQITVNVSITVYFRYNLFQVSLNMRGGKTWVSLHCSLWHSQAIKSHYACPKCTCNQSYTLCSSCPYKSIHTKECYYVRYFGPNSESTVDSE